MAKNERFEKTYSQGTMNVTEIWVDKETGVNYLYHAAGYSGGLTPLLDRDGKPVICDYVIHTVGPIWNGGRTQEEELLASCYFNSMKVALENGIRTIAFPSISTGVYSFPVELAAKIAVKTVNRFLQDNPDSFDLVEWVLFDSHTEEIYEAAVDKTV